MGCEGPSGREGDILRLVLSSGYAGTLNCQKSLNWRRAVCPVHCILITAP